MLQTTLWNNRRKSVAIFSGTSFCYSGTSVSIDWDSVAFPWRLAGKPEAQCMQSIGRWMNGRTDANAPFAEMNYTVIVTAFINIYYHTEKSVKWLLFSLDLYSFKKLFAESPKTSDNAEGRAANGTIHRPFCQGVCGLPVRPLRPGPAYPPALGQSALWPWRGAAIHEAKKIRAIREEA